MRKAAEEEVTNLKNQLYQFTKPEVLDWFCHMDSIEFMNCWWLYVIIILMYQAGGTSCILELHKLLEEETRKNKRLEEENAVLRSQLSQQTLEAGQVITYMPIADPLFFFKSDVMQFMFTFTSCS